MSRLSMNERNLLVEIEYNLRSVADGGAGAAAGSGGSGGDASAANQTTQITAEQAIQATLGATTGAAVTTDANGTIQQYARGIATILGAVTVSPIANSIGDRLKALLTGIVLAAGSAIIGKVGIDQTTPGTTNAVTATGNVADDAADSGNPVLVGGSAQNPDSLPAAVSANDRGKFVTDLSRRIITYLGTTLDETNDKVRAVTEGYKTSYSVSFAGLAPAVTATDILEIIGSATKTVRVTRVQITGVATAAGAYNVVLVKRSTAATGGTSSSATVVPHDSSDAAGTAVIKGYTANPTIGAIVGAVRSQRITVSTGAGAIPIVPVSFDFGIRNARAVVLRGIAQTLCLNLAGVTMTGGLLDIDVEWTEE